MRVAARSRRQYIRRNHPCSSAVAARFDRRRLRCAFFFPFFSFEAAFSLPVARFQRPPPPLRSEDAERGRLRRRRRAWPWRGPPGPADWGRRRRRRDAADRMAWARARKVTRAGGADRGRPPAATVVLPPSLPPSPSFDSATDSSAADLGRDRDAVDGRREGQAPSPCRTCP